MTTTTEVRVLFDGATIWSRFHEDGNSGWLSPGRQATEEQEQVVQLLSEALDQAKGQLDLMKRSE